MCISARASANAFLFNLISVGLLIYYGNENLKTYNIIIGLFTIFTSFMQLVDLGIWLDLDCKTGTNKAASMIGPVLNYLQPTMVFVVAVIILNNSRAGKKLQKKVESSVFKNFAITTEKFNFNNVINLLYFGLVVYTLINHYIREINSKNPFCSGIIGDHIKWSWVGNYNTSMVHSLLYGIIGGMNLYTINPSSNYIKLILILYFLQYFFSKLIYKNHLSEIWCLISNSLTLTLLILQKLFASVVSREQWALR